MLSKIKVKFINYHADKKRKINTKEILKMKKITKILSIILALTLFVALGTACGDKAAVEEKVEQQKAVAEAENNAANEADGEKVTVNDVDEITKAGKIWLISILHFLMESGIIIIY